MATRISPISQQRANPAVERLAYSIRETAEATGLGESQVRIMVKDGRIRSVRVGRRVLIPLDSIRRFMAV